MAGEWLVVRVDPVQVQTDIFFDSSFGNDMSSPTCSTTPISSPRPRSPLPALHEQLGQSRRREHRPRENLWREPNESRYHNPAYDALYDAAATETDPTRTADLLVEMNDLLIDDVAVIPLVHLAATRSPSPTRSERKSSQAAPSNPHWNIANWNRVLPRP